MSRTGIFYLPDDVLGTDRSGVYHVVWHSVGRNGSLTLGVVPVEVSEATMRRVRRADALRPHVPVPRTTTANRAGVADIAPPAGSRSVAVSLPSAATDSVVRERVVMPSVSAAGSLPARVASLWVDVERMLRDPTVSSAQASRLMDGYIDELVNGDSTDDDATTGDATGGDAANGDATGGNQG